MRRRPWARRVRDWVERVWRRQVGGQQMAGGGGVEDGAAEDGGGGDESGQAGVDELTERVERLRERVEALEARLGVGRVEAEAGSGEVDGDGGDGEGEGLVKSGGVEAEGSVEVVTRPGAPQALRGQRARVVKASEIWEGVL